MVADPDTFVCIFQGAVKEEDDIDSFPPIKFQNSLCKFKNLESMEMRLLEGAQPSSTDEQLKLRIISESMFFLLFFAHKAPDISIVNQKLINMIWIDSYETALKLCGDPQTSEIVRKELALQLRRFELGPRGPEVETMPSLFIYLRYAVNLEELTVDFGYRNHAFKGNFDWISDLKMPYLRSVHFTNGRITQYDLLAFFNKHENLKSVHLDSVSLRNGSWTDTIHELSRIRPKIENIEFSGKMPYDDTVERACVCGRVINAYIELVSWPSVGLMRPPRTRLSSIEEMNKERMLRRKREDAGVLGPKGICDSCGLLKEFCVR